MKKHVEVETKYDRKGYITAISIDGIPYDLEEIGHPSINTKDMKKLICSVLGHQDKRIHGYGYERINKNITSQKITVQCQRCERKENVIIIKLS